MYSKFKESKRLKVILSVILSFTFALILFLLLRPYYKFYKTDGFQFRNATNYVSYKNDHPHISNQEVVAIINNEVSFKSLGYTDENIEELLLHLSVEQLDIVIDKSIHANDLMTYLKYSNFDFSLYDTYETIRNTYNQNQLFAVNLATFPFFVSPDYPLDSQPAFFKNSYLTVVNKGLFLTQTYVPSGLENILETDLPVASTMTGTDKSLLDSTALTYLKLLFDDARKVGNDFYAYSGYRSYLRQQSIFNWNYNNDPKTAANLSAKAGHSEHQTGLAIDITTSSVNYQLSADLAHTSEGEWLQKNAHKYGFIIRYPEGKSNITGFDFEPWHLRYVGVNVANTCYEKQWTLEEYVLSTVELGQ